MIRHIAATLVLISHAYPIALGRGASDILGNVFYGTTIGELAVAAFFAISGFLVTASWERFQRDKNGWRGFLCARIFRIFPGLIGAVLFTIVLGAVLTTSPTTKYVVGAIEYFIRTTTLVSISQRLPGVFEENPMSLTINGSLWTLFYEFTLYMLVCLAGLTGLLRRKKFLILSLVSLPLIFLATSKFNISDRVHTLSLLSVPFGTGVLAWVYRDRIPFTFAWVVVTCLIAWAALGTNLSEPILYFSTAILVLYLAHIKNARLKWPSKWGDFSYGIYIYAFPIQQIMAHFWPASPIANVLLSLPPTLIMAAISWHFIEKPSQSFTRACKQ